MQKWPVLALTFFLAILAGWVLTDVAQQAVGPTWVGAILALAPAALGAIIWRIEGLDYAAIASWVAPLACLDIVSIALLTGPASIALYLVSVAILAVMIFTEAGPRFWLAVVRPQSHL
jgi:hypothetical protein